MIERTKRQTARGSITVSALLALLIGVTAIGDDDCGWPPDLWVPADGTRLDGGNVAVQRVSGDVCQGGEITIEFTLVNPSCGDAGPFDVTLTYGSEGHVIDVVRFDGLDGCEYITHTVVWDTTDATPGAHDLGVCVDTDDEVEEMNEGNNCLVIAQDLRIWPNTPYVVAEKLAVDTTGGTVQPGDRIRYEVTIWNYGCADMEDLPGHEFVDELPGAMQATGQVSATSGTAQVSGNEIVWDGRIPAGGSVTIQYRADLDIELEPGTLLCNQGTVFWDSTGDGTHDAETPTDDPTTPELDDPTCLTIDEPVAAPMPLSGTIDAPTLSVWGMAGAVLSFGLALGGHWAGRRRRETAIGR
jgi:hypothetical protein